MADKNTMLAEIAKINAVDGFDPAPFAVDFTDLGSGEVRKRLPVMIQMAWFRLKYPEGKISVEVSPGHDCMGAGGHSQPLSPFSVANWLQNQAGAALVGRETLMTAA